MCNRKVVVVVVIPGERKEQSPPPGLPRRRLQLVDPGLVHVHGVGVGAQALVLDDVFDHGRQQLPERVVAPGPTVEAHHHLDHRGVPRHDVLNLVHLGAGRDTPFMSKGCPG